MYDVLTMSFSSASISLSVYSHEVSRLSASTLPEPIYIDEYQQTQNQIKSEIENLIALWQNETSHVSSVHQMISHPAYLQIIAKGQKALPYIFHELEKMPDYWFAALRAITGEDPVPENIRGDMKGMRDYWIGWAEAEGYV